MPASQAAKSRIQYLMVDSINQIATAKQMVQRANTTHPQGVPVDLGAIQRQFQVILDYNREMQDIIRSNPGLDPNLALPKTMAKNINGIAADIRNLQRRASPRDYEKMLRIFNLVVESITKLANLVEAYSRNRGPKK